MTLHPDVVRELEAASAASRAKKAAERAAETALWEQRAVAANAIEVRLTQIESTLSRVMPFDQLSKLFLEAFAAFEETRIPPLRDEIKSLKAEIKELREREHMKYCGVWRSGVEFQPGDLVTYGGSMWHAAAKTQNKPGTSDDWVLCVRRGRDGRDAGMARTPQHDEQIG
jgi:hypothetical protein